MTAPAAPPDAPPPYAAVAFDCDSTLSSIEGIDELARALDPQAQREIASLTDRAMRGEIALEQVYALRLERIRPSRDAIERLGERYVETLVPGARELVAALRALGKRVYVVSGGIRGAVETLARALEIPPSDVRAVALTHDGDGRYVDFERDSPLSTQHGKHDVVGELASAHDGSLAFVGDGATDLAAARAARRFVAYGGVIRRESVFASARCRSDARSLLNLTRMLLAEDEMARLASRGSSAI